MFKEKKQFLEVGPLNDISELKLESDPLHVIIVGMDFSAVDVLEVGPLNHISEYILERNCFHMIFLGKDLHTVAGINSVIKWMAKETFVVYQIQEKRNNYWEWGS